MQLLSPEEVEQESRGKPSSKMAEQYKTRRMQLFKKMSQQSIAVLPGADIQYRNHDAEYPFRQSSPFYYLTGFNEPGAVLVMSKDDEEDMEFILFCEEKNPESEIWTGKKFGPKDCEHYFGAQKGFSIAEFDKIMPKLLENKNKLYYSLGQIKEFDNRMLSFVNQVKEETRKGIHAPETWIDFVSMIDNERVLKSKPEIDLIKKACSISAEAHKKLMQLCKPGKKEYELEGEFIYACTEAGARFMAYSPIVAAGDNACTLHYTDNDQTIKSNDLVLIDAGCEYQYYASDITRTFPANGRFTQDQRAIYELVLAAQMAAIDIVKPGLHWNKLQEIILEVLVSGLVQLGILQGSVDKLIQDKAYRQYYMHSSGHWLGLDVHDGGEYKIKGEWRPLEAGMVFTIEPGLYFAPNNPKLDKRWWGIGVRIEDDILVTREGCEVLTQEVPKSVHEIEKLMCGTR